MPKLRVVAEIFPLGEPPKFLIGVF